MQRSELTTVLPNVPPLDFHILSHTIDELLGTPFTELGKLPLGRVKDEHLINLINTTKIESLILKGCGNIKGDNLGLFLEFLTNLRELNLNGCTGLDKLEPIFRNCIAPLTTVYLRSLHNLMDIDVTVATLFHRCHATLTHLDIDNVFITAEAFTDIDLLPPMKLSALILESAPQLMDGALRRLLPHVSNLQIVSLRLATLLSNLALTSFICAAPNLRYIDISDIIQVSDDLIDNITISCRDLTILKVRRCVNLTDDAVASLAGRSHGLKEVYLDGNMNFTPLAVKVLAASCSMLEKVSLFGCVRIDQSPVYWLWRGLRDPNDTTGFEDLDDFGDGDRVVVFESREEVMKLASCDIVPRSE
ncbi:hypothetical protein HDU76_010015 [Blyttiomyces sp. JEL0837]|nr:hypothetical protein HDU76_010015 [Blyttiomyces sp. JEL0837]